MKSSLFLCERAPVPATPKDSWRPPHAGDPGGGGAEMFPLQFPRDGRQ